MPRRKFNYVYSNQITVSSYEENIKNLWHPIKNIRQIKMQENMTHNKEKKTTKAKPKMTQVAELAENNNKELPSVTVVKSLPAHTGNTEMQARFLNLEDAPEKEMATHSSILAWRIPWTGEPGGLWFMGSQRVGHD